MQGVCLSQPAFLEQTEASLREGVGATNRLQLGYRLALEDLRAD